MRPLGSGLHDECFACGHCGSGLGLVFEKIDDSTVTAEWLCDKTYQSYHGIVHGGIIATILDSAMTNCLLTNGVSAVTAEMHVRYHKPLRVGKKVTVRATLVRSRPPLFELRAEVIQNDEICAEATAKFMRADVWSDNHV